MRGEAQCVIAGFADKVRALRSPAAYPDPPHAIEAIETHFAWVFLTDAHAYKLKKPVRTAYLDLTSADARRANCHDELRLNRRLAADVYLEVIPVTQDADGAIRAGGEGMAIDWLVKMRRLPAALMLDHAIAAGTVAPEALDRVGKRLASFHRAQQRIGLDPGAYVARIAGQIEEDRIDLRAPELGLDKELVEAVAQAQRSALERFGEALAERAAQGRIVEAHGDLRPEHVCLSDPVYVIDCLEFSLDLRTLDPAEELGFLWVECEHAGAGWAGRRVFDAWCADAGDPVRPALMNLYRSRRATVRGKLVAWHLRDPEVSAAAAWADQAKSYLRCARRYVAA